MSPPPKPPKKRNLAAKALRSPLFRPKVIAKPAADKRRKKITRNQVDIDPDDQIN